MPFPFRVSDAVIGCANLVLCTFTHSMYETRRLFLATEQQIEILFLLEMNVNSETV